MDPRYSTFGQHDPRQRSQGGPPSHAPNGLMTYSFDGLSSSHPPPSQIYPQQHPHPQQQQQAAYLQNLQALYETQHGSHYGQHLYAPQPYVQHQAPQTPAAQQQHYLSSPQYHSLAPHSPQYHQQHQATAQTSHATPHMYQYPSQNAVSQTYSNTSPYQLQHQHQSHQAQSSPIPHSQFQQSISNVPSQRAQSAQTTSHYQHSAHNRGTSSKPPHNMQRPQVQAQSKLNSSGSRPAPVQEKPPYSNPYPDQEYADLDGVNENDIKPVHSAASGGIWEKQKLHMGLPQAKRSPDGVQKVDPLEPSIDNRTLLLSLADEYISTARASAHAVDLQAGDSSATQQYYRLIASGLACYETVLQTPSLQLNPRQEALVRLRFATLLHEETDNDRIVEETLAKGIALCERNRLTDLKYSKQHLLARVVFGTKPKAAFKQIDKAIEEAKVSRNVAWIYAFQFLRVSMLSQQDAHEMKLGVSALQTVAELAKSQRDSGICSMACIREAMLHMCLRGPDWHEEVDRALATARAQHMSMGDHAPPQVGALLQLLDLVSSFEPCSPKQIEQKRKLLLEYFDNTIHAAEWSKDGVFLLPLKGQVSDTLEGDSCGIFSADDGGRASLRLKWLEKTAVFALAYLLNAMASHYKPASSDRVKAEELLKEALKYTKKSNASRGTSMPLTAASEDVHVRKRIRCHILLNMIFSQCNRWNLHEATATMTSLKALLKTPGMNASENLTTLLVYLEAMIMHANGQVDDALQAYQSPRLKLDDTASVSSVKQQLGILAALSAILIVRAPSHPSHHILRPLLEKMSPLFADIKSSSDAYERGVNPQLSAAYSLVLATSHEDRWSEDNNTSVLSTKKHLQVCFHVGKDMMNHLLLTAGLSFLHVQMFHGQVGEQALKSAQNAQEFARNSGSLLWMCATDNIAAVALDKNGMATGAQAAYENGVRTASKLPSSLQEVLNATETPQDNNGTGTH